MALTRAELLAAALRARKYPKGWGTVWGSTPVWRNFDPYDAGKLIKRGFNEWEAG